jgi:hypothetical protein
LSIDLTLPTGEESLDGFQIITHGLTVLALCHKPRAWIVSFGNGNEPGGGYLGAQAKTPEDDLGPANLKDLLGMYLVVADERVTQLIGILRVRNSVNGETHDIPIPTSAMYWDRADGCS